MWYEKNVAAMHKAIKEKREELFAILKKKADNIVDASISFCAGYSIDKEELYSVANVEVVRAVNRGLRGAAIDQLVDKISQVIADAVVAEITYQDSMASLDILDNVAGDLGFEDVAADIADNLSPWMMNSLRRAVKSLPDRHRLVLEHRFGLGGKPLLTYSQLAVRLGRSVERARTMEHEAVKMVRDSLFRIYYGIC